MVVDAYSPSNPNQVHEDVLLKSRDACYKARDAFYACLEKESGEKPTEMRPSGFSILRSVAILEPSSSKAAALPGEYCRNKRVARLLDDGDERKGPMSLPQPYTFKPSPFI